MCAASGADIFIEPLWASYACMNRAIIDLNHKPFLMQSSSSKKERLFEWGHAFVTKYMRFILVSFGGLFRKLKPCGFHMIVNKTIWLEYRIAVLQSHCLLRASTCNAIMSSRKTTPHPQSRDDASHLIR
jgi:hypothetical protein